jgi:hypothetical protein
VAHVGNHVAPGAGRCPRSLAFGDRG